MRYAGRHRVALTLGGILGLSGVLVTSGPAASEPAATLSLQQGDPSSTDLRLVGTEDRDAVVAEPSPDDNLLTYYSVRPPGTLLAPVPFGEVPDICDQQSDLIVTCPYPDEALWVLLGAEDDAFTFSRYVRHLSYLRVEAGPGDDRLSMDGVAADDGEVMGGDGDDVIVGRFSHVDIDAGRGRDIVATQNTYYTYGGPGDDYIVTSESGSSASGMGGADTIIGGSDPDNPYSESDILFGGPGPDLVIGGGERDFLHGGAGADRIRSRDGRADRKVHCGKGRDRVVADSKDPVRSCELASRRAPGSP